MPNSDSANRLAIASLVASAVTLVLFFPVFVLVPITAVVAIVLGVVARRRGGQTLAAAGIAVGAVLLLIWVALVVTFLVRYGTVD